MNLIDANAYLFEDVQPIHDSQTLHEFDWIKQSQKLHPKVFIAYDRCAFTDREHHSVRITIDSNIRWRSSEIGLEHGAHGKDIHILEIKVKESFPLWLVRILDNLEIYPCSFSKYSQCYIDLLNRKEALRL